MSLERYQRAFRSIGGYSGGTSRTARAPQRLLERDIRPIPGLPDCVPPPPFTIHDNFDRGSYSPEPTLHGSTSTSGHTWVQYVATYKIGVYDPLVSPPWTQSVAYHPGPGNVALVGFDYGTQNVELAARCVDAGATNNRGLFFRLSGSSCYVAGHGSLARFTNVTTGVATTLGTFPTLNNRMVLEVTMSGGDIEVRQDGAVVLTVTDPSPLSGTSCGLYTRFAESDPITRGEGFYDFGYPYNPCDPEAFV